LRVQRKEGREEKGTYDFQRPDPSDPYFQLTLHAVHVSQFDALPPAPPGGLAPEEEQFLRHPDGGAVAQGFVAFDVGAEPGEGEGADDCFLGLARSVAPGVFVVEASVYIRPIS